MQEGHGTDADQSRRRPRHEAEGSEFARNDHVQEKGSPNDADEDKDALDELGFFESEECFQSFRFGSA